MSNSSDETIKEENTRLHSQAERIIKKFKNARVLSRILTEIGRPRDKSTIYKWLYPRNRQGTGGLVPTKAWDDVLAAARYEGIIITSEDMDPRPLPFPVTRMKYIYKPSVAEKFQAMYERKVMECKKRGVKPPTEAEFRNGRGNKRSARPRPSEAKKKFKL
jgi:hypothetical protein